MRCILTTALFLLATLPCLAQNNSFPSTEEISELVHKADEKVTTFEQAVRVAKPYLSEDRFKNNLGAATAAHQITVALNKNGPSAYALVALVITLDDLVIDAGLSSQDILSDGLTATSSGKSTSASSLAAVMALNNSATACRDISELIGHATLRLIDTEEKVLRQAKN